MSPTGKDAQPSQDGMPTTRGMNFYLEDRNLHFLCESVMDAETFERARPYLAEMGEVAGGEPGVSVASVGPDRARRNCLRCGLPEELVSNGGDA